MDISTHISISTHYKRLKYSNSAVFVDIVIPSWCQRAVNFLELIATRRQYDGFTKSCCLPKQLGTFLFPSYCIREEKLKCPMSPKIIRRKDEEDTIRQDSFTMASQRARWTHEFNTKTHLREAFRNFFDMPKILRRSRTCCRSLRKFTGDHTMA